MCSPALPKAIQNHFVSQVVDESETIMLFTHTVKAGGPEPNENGNDMDYFPGGAEACGHPDITVGSG